MPHRRTRTPLPALYSCSSAIFACLASIHLAILIFRTLVTSNWMNHTIILCIVCSLPVLRFPLFSLLLVNECVGFRSLSSETQDVIWSASHATNDNNNNIERNIENEILHACLPGSFRYIYFFYVCTVPVTIIQRNVYSEFATKRRRKKSNKIARPNKMNEIINKCCRRFLWISCSLLCILVRFAAMPAFLSDLFLFVVSCHFTFMREYMGWVAIPSPKHVSPLIVCWRFSAESQRPVYDLVILIV